LRQAREEWLRGLELLPPTSKQADWIKQHAQELDALDDRGRRPPPAENQWAQPVGPSPVVADASRAGASPRFRLTSLLSFVAFLAIYSAASGVRFGIGFAVLILIHEMGHFIDIKRRGLPADMPVFLPGLGAYVRWQALGVPLETRAAVSLAGPLAGFFASLACAALWWQTHNPYWGALARVGAMLNLLNLIPVWVLDGGQAGGCRFGAGARRKVVLPGGTRCGVSSILCRRSAGASQPRHDYLFCRSAYGAGGDHSADAGPGFGLGVKSTP
jgi:hypothetical protein